MLQNLLKNSALFRLLFTVAFGAITYIAFLPNYDTLPQIASFSDLLNHAVAFMVLYLLLEYARVSDSMVKKATFFLFYALFIELVQYFLPTRCADFYDVIADMFGVVTALMLLRLLDKA